MAPKSPDKVTWEACGSGQAQYWRSTLALSLCRSIRPTQVPNLVTLVLPYQLTDAQPISSTESTTLSWAGLGQRTRELQGGKPCE